MIRRLITASLVLALGGGLASAATYSELQSADQEGNEDAIREVGHSHFSGKESVVQGESKEESSVIPVVRSASPDAEEEFRKGMELKDKDPEKAFSYFAAAAEKGHSQAQYSLGCCYDNGEGTPRNEAEAVKRFKKSAEQGHVDAQYNLAIFYAVGIGTDKDDEEAFMWFKRAAEQGDAQAQVSLAIRFEKGIGTDRDEEMAFMWCKRAAEQGDADAQSILGEYYLAGIGTAKDENEGIKWATRGAVQRYARRLKKYLKINKPTR